jgi:integrase
MKIHGDGSIEQMEKDKTRARCRKWRLWIYTERGKRSRRFQGTYTQAKDALEDFKDSVAGRVTSDRTFAAYAAEWMRYRMLSKSVEASTSHNDKYHLNVINRYVGDVTISDIEPRDCKKALLDMLSKYSATYVGDLYVTWKAVMSAAVADGVISDNPLASVKPPKPDTAEKDWLEPAALNDFVKKVEAMQPSGRTMALLMIAGLGLRRAEAVAMADSAVVIDPTTTEGVASVTRAYKEKTGEIGTPKSKAGVRDLPKPSWLVRDVIRWREWREALGLGDAETLCCNVYGGVLATTNFYGWWVKHRDELGCEGFGLHQLRHSNLSMMARYMSPYDLMRWAGWSDISPAMIYVHSDFYAVKSALRSAEKDVWGAPNHHPNHHL